VTKNVSQHTENSCTNVEQVVQSSYDTSAEHHVNTIDDVSNGISMLAQGVQSDGTAVHVKRQHSSIFQSQCNIQDKVCKLIIDGARFTNTISSNLVAALSLSTRRLPMPCYMQWMNQSGMLKITHKARVKFFISNYIDAADCDVVPLSACHLLLGQPWQFDLDATHIGHSNTYSFMHKSLSHVLKPMIETAIKVHIFAAMRKTKKDPPMDTPKPRTALFHGKENDVAILGGDLKANCNNKVLLQGVENDVVTPKATTIACMDALNAANIFSENSCSEEMEKKEDIINLISPTSV
jgi:hypothetical protein